MTSTFHTVLLSKARNLLPGILLCIAVTAAAGGLAWLEARLMGRAWVEALVIAILLGTLIRSLWTPPAILQSGIAYAGKQMLEFAVMLLGASVSALTIIAAGPLLMVSVILLVIGALTASYLIGRALDLPAKMATLIASGNAICGNSAIAAVAPVIGATKEDVAASIAFTAVLGVITVLILPLVGDFLSMTMSQYGTLAGMTVYAVPQVLAATVPVGPEAVEMGTLVKLVRVLMLGPVCVVLAIIVHRAGQKAGGAAKLGFSKMVPWFIIGFLGMLTVRSLGLIPEMILDSIKLVAGILTTIAMAALGLGVDVRVVARAGGKVTAAVTLSLVMLAVISVTLIRILGVA
ncbi:MAG: YeiH family protein [Prosthecobacter sp.]|uniref:YeiH family protein n=1 Tax=Prosthecobacter sp. TaxID=1965333 RepID=UPI0039013B3C